MNNIKKFLSFTRFLWIGGIISLMRMILGNPDYFWDIMNYLGLYSAVTLILIHRNKPLKRQFIDIFLFFVGIDLFSMIYIFAVYKLTYSVYNIFSFLFWTVTGILTALWGLLATRFRNKNLKIFYIIMLIPLFAVIFLEFAEASIETWLYLGDEYKRINNMTVLPYAGPSPRNKLAVVLTDLAGLIICSIIYIKKKKSDTQIKGTF